MLEGSLCTECLSMQFYDPPTQACKTCHESCRSCSGPGQYSCVTCAFPLHLDRLNNQCVPCCTSDATPEDQSCCHCDKDTGRYYANIMYALPRTTRHVVPLLFKLKPAKLKDLLLFVGTTFARRRLPRPSTSRAGALCLEVGDIFAV